MTILDRYLLRQFVQVFLICFLSMLGLYVVIDAFGHLDSFSKHAEQNGNIFLVIAEYYSYQSLTFFEHTGGILVMTSTLFTVIWLQRHQEMTAMLAAGISKIRIVRPLLIAAIFLSFLGVANREILIPKLRNELNRSTDNISGDQPSDLEAKYDKNKILVGGDKIIIHERQILNPLFFLPRELSKYGKQLTAKKATHFEATLEHPAGYLFESVKSPDQITRRKSLSLKNKKILFTPLDTPWLKAGQVFLASSLPFQHLASGTSWHQVASTNELIEELQNPSTDIDAKIRVAVHSRITRPISDVTLMMLGLPLMFSRRQHNVFLSVGICLLVAMSFFIVMLACQSLGSLSLLRPTLAAWLPIMIFVPIAAAISHTLRT